jgi:predicted amidohydrolase YtcJ
VKLIKNVVVYTMDENRTKADCMVWDNETIIALGKFDDIGPQYPEAEVIEGKGLTLLPGFIDSHIHFLDGVIYQKFLDCTLERVSTIGP